MKIFKGFILLPTNPKKNTTENERVEKNEENLS